MKNTLNPVKVIPFNIIIGNYEIFFNDCYAIIKDTLNIKYYRLYGTLYDFLLNHYCDNDIVDQIEKIIHTKKMNVSIKKPLLQINFKGKVNNIIRYIPSFFFNYIVVLITILIMLIVGTLIALFKKIEFSNNIYFFLNILYLIINIFFHELGHVIFCLKAGRKVYSYGFKLNFGIPMFYIDTSDICMAKKKERILTSLGGVYFNSIIGIFIFILAVFLKNNNLVVIANISYYFVLSNLLPFIRLDGYYVMSDLLEVNNLSKEAKKSFINCNKLEKTRKTIILLIYQIISSVFKVFLIIFIVLSAIKLVIM